MASSLQGMGDGEGCEVASGRERVTMIQPYRLHGRTCGICVEWSAPFPILRTYVCVTCRREVPWCDGKDDDMPDSCDDCWARAHKGAQP